MSEASVSPPSISLLNILWLNKLIKFISNFVKLYSHSAPVMIITFSNKDVCLIKCMQWIVSSSRFCFLCVSHKLNLLSKLNEDNLFDLQVEKWVMFWSKEQQTWNAFWLTFYKSRIEEKFFHVWSMWAC